MIGCLLGIDLSHYQPNYDFSAAKAAGVAFVGVQLTVGTGDDALGASHLRQAKAAGIAHLMAYAFATAGSGVAQAEHFFDRLKTVDPGVMAVLDIEPKEGATQQVVLDFLNHWGRITDKPLAIYSGPGAYRAVMGSRSFDLAKRYPFISWLWNADYRGGRIKTAQDQRFDVYYAAGLYGYGGFSHAPIVQFGPAVGTDGDAFAGDATELAALFGATPPKAPTVVYRYGGVPDKRGTYKAVKRKYVRSTPGIPQNDFKGNVIAPLAPGDTFRAYQSITKANGHIWLGSADGSRWVLDDRRLVVAK